MCRAAINKGYELKFGSKVEVTDFITALHTNNITKETIRGAVQTVAQTKSKSINIGANAKIKFTNPLQDYMPKTSEPKVNTESVQKSLKEQATKEAKEKVEEIKSEITGTEESLEEQKATTTEETTSEDEPVKTEITLDASLSWDFPNIQDRDSTRNEKRRTYTVDIASGTHSIAMKYISNSATSYTSGALTSSTRSKEIGLDNSATAKVAATINAKIGLRSLLPLKMSMIKKLYPDLHQDIQAQIKQFKSGDTFELQYDLPESKKDEINETFRTDPTNAIRFAKQELNNPKNYIITNLIHYRYTQAEADGTSKGPDYAKYETSAGLLERAVLKTMDLRGFRALQSTE